MKKETSYYHNKGILKKAYPGNNTYIKIITVYNDKYGAAELALIDRELMLIIAENIVRCKISDNYATTVIIKSMQITPEDQLKIVAVLIHDLKIKDAIEKYI